MRSAEIRQSFLNFFAGQDHKVLPSSSLIPHEDSSVLLTTAGMQQFKPYFMGLAEPPVPRAVTIQKCFRTSDLEEVGDLTHLTFFEMLGNFSFGDYFKEAAIEYCWQYLTQELAIDPARLQPTIHPDDAESAVLWPKVTGRTPFKLADNFWAAGPTGPCGPDSETYFDWGPSVGCGRPDCYPGHCDRFLELWNLVFMQYDRKPDGSMEPLAKPGVDTGMGLERLAAVLMGAPENPDRQVSVYETDILDSLRRHFEGSNDTATDDDPRARAARLLADHARGTTFLVADGVRPGNEGRGYVLRRMIRRATLQGSRALGLDRPLSGAVPLVAELMGDAYPELRQRQSEIVSTLEAEETSFQRTLKEGEAAFADVASRARGIIAGGAAFRLHDTFGFPIDLTVELAGEAGLQVDRAGFEENLAEARQRSRRGARRQVAARTGLPGTEFLGYDTTAAQGTVTRLFTGDAEAQSVGEGEDEVEVYLDRTPMYAEAGGQVGDIGLIEGPAGTIEVRDVQRQGEAYAHYGRVASGTVTVGDAVQAEVDEATRWATMRHHSATHLLHRALREVLGEAAHQAGSHVGPESSTFDFNLDRAVSPEELEAVFRIVNRAVRDDLPRTTRVVPLEEARQSGAMMLFGEKYGDTVRVVSFGEFSSELCGGTHVDRTGQVGLVMPVAEKSVGAGLRRVEFLAGEAAERHTRGVQDAAATAADALHVGVEELGDRVAALVAERKALQKQVDELKLRVASTPRGGETAIGSNIGGVVSQTVDEGEADHLRALADGMLDRDRDARLSVVFSTDGGRVAVKIRRGFEILPSDIMQVLKSIGGGHGGGGGQLVMGGGYDLSHSEAMLTALRDLVATNAATEGT